MWRVWVLQVVMVWVVVVGTATENALVDWKERDGDPLPALPSITDLVSEVDVLFLLIFPFDRLFFLFLNHLLTLVVIKSIVKVIQPTDGENRGVALEHRS